MENEKLAEVKEETTEVTETTVKKTGVKERIVNSRPVGWAKRHWKGLVAGVATAGAVGAAGVFAMKAAADQALEVPFDVDGVVDAIPTPGDEA